MTIDTNLCPLCGGDNRCGMAADPLAQGCWCRSAEFGAAIALLPEAARGKVCICARCAREAELAASSAVRQES